MCAKSPPLCGGDMHVLLAWHSRNMLWNCSVRFRRWTLLLRRPPRRLTPTCRRSCALPWLQSGARAPLPRDPPTASYQVGHCIHASSCLLCAIQAASAGHDSSDGKGFTYRWLLPAECSAPVGRHAHAGLIRRALCSSTGGARRGPRPPFPPRQNPSSDAIVLLGEDDSSMHTDQNGSSSAQAPPGPAPKQPGTQANAGEVQKKEDVLKNGAAKVIPI